MKDKEYGGAIYIGDYCKLFNSTRPREYFSGNAHLPKYNICGWLICGEWKLADVVIRKVVAGDTEDVKTPAPPRLRRS